jgi:hypothetical protein
MVTASDKQNPKMASLSMAATHCVSVTREKLSVWFDSKYDDGFAWNSVEGVIE